jgi:hypothetical protein
MISALLDAGGFSVLKPESAAVDRAWAALGDAGHNLRQVAPCPRPMPRAYTLTVRAGRAELWAVLQAWNLSLAGAKPVLWRHWNDDAAPPAAAVPYRMVSMTPLERASTAAAGLTLVLERWEVPNV